MGEVRDRVAEILGSKLLGDPNVLQARVFGEETVSTEEALLSAFRFLESVISALFVLAEEIDDLRTSMQADTDSG
jgi:hypothetical protein